MGTERPAIEIVDYGNAADVIADAFGEIEHMDGAVLVPVLTARCEGGVRRHYVVAHLRFQISNMSVLVRQLLLAAQVQPRLDCGGTGKFAAH